MGSIATAAPVHGPGLTGMADIPGGVFRMGSDAHYVEERPAHLARVGPFRIDHYTITNAEFARFVDDTGYLTLAKRPYDLSIYPGADATLAVPGALVFWMTSGPINTTNIHNWWHYVPGACWRHPEGPDSDLSRRELHPVVHVAFEDAEAYAAWAGKASPTEAEWEFAARDDLDGVEFVWGDEFTPGGIHRANAWQGPFPWRNFETDGWAGTAPVGTFGPNGYGLYEVAGNALE